MVDKTTKYLFFYKDAAEVEKQYLEQNKDRDDVFFLRTEFKVYVMDSFKREIVDMCMKFDENNNPFTVVAYIDFGKIHYTKFDEKIHAIEY